jgi:hypothetical protein
VDFEWIKDVDFLAIKLGKVGYVYRGFGHTNLNTHTKEGEGSLPAENGSQGALK